MTHRRMMLLRGRMGDRIGALRQYEDCVKTLKRGLQIAPDGETRALRDQIASGRLNPRTGWTPLLLPTLRQRSVDDRRLSACISG